jgi:hypothetical protein
MRNRLGFSEGLQDRGRDSERGSSLKLLIALFLAAFCATAQAPAVVKYRASISDVKYVYGVAPPVAHVKPGEIIETNTLDAFGNVLRKPGERLSMVKGDNPLTGPFYLDGAQPGDTPEVSPGSFLGRPLVSSLIAGMGEHSIPGGAVR